MVRDRPDDYNDATCRQREGSVLFVEDRLQWRDQRFETVLNRLPENAIRTDS